MAGDSEQRAGGELDREFAQRMRLRSFAELRPRSQPTVRDGNEAGAHEARPYEGGYDQIAARIWLRVALGRRAAEALASSGR
jgi:hypothetical protein